MWLLSNGFWLTNQKACLPGWKNWYSLGIAQGEGCEKLLEHCGNRPSHAKKKSDFNSNVCCLFYGVCLFSSSFHALHVQLQLNIVMNCKERGKNVLVSWQFCKSHVLYVQVKIACNIRHFTIKMIVSYIIGSSDNALKAVCICKQICLAAHCLSCHIFFSLNPLTHASMENVVFDSS